MKKFIAEMQKATTNLSENRNNKVLSSWEKVQEIKAKMINIGQSVSLQTEACILASEVLDSLTYIAGLARMPVLISKDQVEEQEDYHPESKSLKVFKKGQYLCQRAEKLIEMTYEELENFEANPLKQNFLGDNYRLLLVKMINTLGALKKIIIDTELSTERSILYTNQMRPSALTPDVLSEYFAAMFFLAILKKVNLEITTDFSSNNFRLMCLTTAELSNVINNLLKNNHTFFKKPFFERIEAELFQESSNI